MPDVVASMEIIDNGPGQLNYFNDTPTAYDGAVLINVRGHTSRSFAKKSFSLKTVFTPENTTAADPSVTPDACDDNDVVLLDMPSEHDWVLYGAAVDKTLIRAALIFNLSSESGEYAPATRFVEVFLNATVYSLSNVPTHNNLTYQGVYVLMEKPKRGKDRIDVKKLKSDENSLPDVSGGYILKADKIHDGDNDTVMETEDSTRLTVVYPKTGDLSYEQLSYILGYVNDFERAVTAGVDPDNGTTGAYSLSSAVTYMLINEFIKNVDGYRYSGYITKDRDDVLEFGPLWDVDLALGNAKYGGGATVTGWQVFNNIEAGTPGQVPGWWPLLATAPRLQSYLQTGWRLFRRGVLDDGNGLLSDAHVNATIDAMVTEIWDAQVRNYRRWGFQDTWPSPVFYFNYLGYVNYMKSFIFLRSEFLDENINQIAVRTPCGFQSTAIAADSFTGTTYMQPTVQFGLPSCNYSGAGTRFDYVDTPAVWYQFIGDGAVWNISACQQGLSLPAAQPLLFTSTDPSSCIAPGCVGDYDSEGCPVGTRGQILLVETVLYQSYFLLMTVSQPAPYVGGPYTITISRGPRPTPPESPTWWTAAHIGYVVGGVVGGLALAAVAIVGGRYASRRRGYSSIGKRDDERIPLDKKESWGNLT